MALCLFANCRQQSSPKGPATGLPIWCYTVVKMALTYPLWDVLLPSNLRWANIFHEIVRCLTFNIWFVFYVLLWMKCRWEIIACSFCKTTDIKVWLVLSYHYQPIHEKSKKSLGPPIRYSLNRELPCITVLNCYQWFDWLKFNIYVCVNINIYMHIYTHARM